MADAAAEYARNYAKQRIQFGVPIAQKQAIAFMLAEMAIEVDAARLMTWEAAWKLDEGQDASKEAYLAKQYADKAALFVTDSAVQTLGGYGFIREYPVERWLRNARGFTTFHGLGNGMSEIVRRKEYVQPIDGAQPEIGRFLYGLELSRQRTNALLDQIVPGLIDWKPNGALHTVGTVLYHIAVIEADWLYVEVLGTTDYQDYRNLMEPLFPYPIRTNKALTVVTGQSMEEHRQRMNEVRRRLLDTYKAMTLEDFRRVRALEETDVSPEWVLFHLTQHETEHRAEISALQTIFLRCGMNNMPINFEIPEHITQQMEMVKMAAEYSMRPVSRELDEHEHERPTQFVETMWPFMRDMTKSTLEKVKSGESAKPRDPNRPRTTNLRLMLMIEILSWGDAGIYLCLPGGSLGGAAIEATGTPEQKVKFLTRFAEGETPAWGAMAMTEPGAGSDTSAISTTAVFDEATNEWVINGEKIFCTNGKLALDESNGLVVVWASIDREAGRAGMRPFVVEAGTPGVKVAKTEIKHGIRASDTAAIVFDNARIPADHLLGSAEVTKARRSTRRRERLSRGDGNLRRDPSAGGRQRAWHRAGGAGIPEREAGGKRRRNSL